MATHSNDSPHGGSSDSPRGGRQRMSARDRAAAGRELQRKRDARRRMLIIGGSFVALIAVVAVMVIVYATKGDKKVAASTAAPAAAVKTVTTIPASTFGQVGFEQGADRAEEGQRLGVDVRRQARRLLRGAEYCPYCASERWPLVVALSRFGTWSNLAQTVSGPAPELYPATPTFSFFGATYSSPYLAFQSVETATNQLKDGRYTALQTPTEAQASHHREVRFRRHSVPRFRQHVHHRGWQLQPRPARGQVL